MTRPHGSTGKPSRRGCATTTAPSIGKRPARGARSPTPAPAPHPRLLPVSEAAKRDLHAALGIPEQQITVTHNGVDSAFFEARAPEGPRQRYLLAVGTLEPRKNLPALLEAFGMLRLEGRDLQLVLVGRQGWAHSLPLRAPPPSLR